MTHPSLLSIIAATTIVLTALPLSQQDSVSYAASRPSGQVQPANPSTSPWLFSATPEAGCEPSTLAATPQPGELVDLDLVLEVQLAPGQVLDDAVLDGIRSVLENRLELLDVPGEVRRQSDERIVIRLDRVEDPQRLADAVTGTMLIEFIDPQGRDLQPGTDFRTTLGAPGAIDAAASATPVSPSGGSNPVFETIVSGRDFTEV